MEANMAEIADATCEHAQYIQEEIHLIYIERQQKENMGAW